MNISIDTYISSDMICGSSRHRGTRWLSLLLALCLAIILTLLPHSAQAQIAVHGTPRTMDSIFVEMPDSLLPLISRSSRMDCIDFIASGMRAVVTNKLGDKSEVPVLTDDYLEILPSPASRMQVRRLHFSDGEIAVCVAYTTYAPQPYSDIAIYDTAWRRLATSVALPTDTSLWREYKLSKDSDNLIVISRRAACQAQDNGNVSLTENADSATYTWTGTQYVAMTGK